MITRILVQNISFKVSPAAFKELSNIRNVSHLKTSFQPKDGR